MNENPQLVPSEARIALQDCFARIRLARATELALSGRLIEAEAVLAQNGELPSNANELDLLARIATRQGRFDEARRRWNAAIQKEPGNEIYQQCINNLTQTRRIALLIRASLEPILFILALLTAAFGIGVMLHTFWPSK